MCVVVGARKELRRFSASVRLPEQVAVAAA